MKKSFPSALALAALFLLGGDLRGQDASAQDLEAELRAMVAEPTQADRDRQVVREFLDRVDVSDVVTTLGLDRERLETGVNTLEADAAIDLARQVRALGDEADLVGGDTIVISATTVIIILLIILILA
jgi:uncharacterized protein (DUF3084 family)